jgi:hypothetical protein
MKRKFTTSLDEDLLEKVKIEAIKRKISVSDILTALLEKFLSNKIDIDTSKK